MRSDRIHRFVAKSLGGVYALLGAALAYQAANLALKGTTMTKGDPALLVHGLSRCIIISALLLTVALGLTLRKRWSLYLHGAICLLVWGLMIYLTFQPSSGFSDHPLRDIYESLVIVGIPTAVHVLIFTRSGGHVDKQGRLPCCHSGDSSSQSQPG